MKRHLGSIVVVTAALLCGLAFSQGPAIQDPNATRFEKLEQDLGASRLRVEALTAETAELKRQVAAITRYLDDQSKAAGAMAQTLDESEEAGFTYGINPNSRHVLLRGWRDQLDAAQKGVSSASPAPAPPTVPPKGPSR